MAARKASAAVRRLQRARAAVVEAKARRANAAKVRVDLWRNGTQQPTWPEKRPPDVWIVIGTPDDSGVAPNGWNGLRPTVLYLPAPTLARFSASPARVRCVIGPLGSGKSSACAAEMLRRAFEQRPGPDGKRRTRFAIIRNSYRTLKDTTRRTFEEWIPPQAGHWRESDFTFRLSVGDVRSEFMFRSLDQPGDVKKLLSLELTGAYINEAREISKPILDMLTGRIGRFPSMMQGGPTWKGIIADTNPWWPGHWADKVFREAAPRFMLFRQPGARSPDAENLKNLDPDYYSDLLIGKDSEWIKVYVDGEDSDGAIGSIYGNWLSALRMRAGVSPFEHGTDAVVTSWDLGIGDACAIWFWRFSEEGGVDLIDHYENRGEAFPHYAAVVDSRGYDCATHYFPHDSLQRSFQTGRTTIEQASERWPGKVTLTPSISVAEGIGAARWLLEQPTTRFHARCDEVAPGAELSALGLLGEYKFEFDEIAKVFSRNPLHNFASHTADAFRYVACVVQAERLSRPAPRKSDEMPKNFVFIGADGRQYINLTFKELADATIRGADRRRRRQHL